MRHPILGPLLILFVAALLAFLVFHAVEDGTAGELIICAMAVAAAARLLLRPQREPSRRELRPLLPGRAPPPRARRHAAPAYAAPAALLSPPLRA